MSSPAPGSSTLEYEIKAQVGEMRCIEARVINALLSQTLEHQRGSFEPLTP